MRYGDAFKVLLDDTENRASNLLHASIYTLIPVIGPIALGGWHCELAQRLHRKDPHPVPKLELGDMGEWIGRGIAPFLAGVLVTLPMVALVFVLQLAMIPLMIAGGDSAIFVVMPIFLVLGLVVSLFTAVASQALLTRAELLEDIGETINVSANLDYVRRNVGRILLTTLVAGCIAVPLGIAGMLACCIGMLPVQVIVQAALVHLRVQIYEAHLADGGQAIERTQASSPTL